MNDELERMRQEAAVPYLVFCPVFCVRAVGLYIVFVFVFFATSTRNTITLRELSADLLMFKQLIHILTTALNTLRTGLLNCLNARSRGLIQSEVRIL